MYFQLRTTGPQDRRTTVNFQSVLEFRVFSTQDHRTTGPQDHSEFSISIGISCIFNSGPQDHRNSNTFSSFNQVTSRPSRSDMRVSGATAFPLLESHLSLFSLPFPHQCMSSIRLGRPFPTLGEDGHHARMHRGNA